MAMDISERIQTLLEKERYQEVLSLGKAEENQTIVKEQSWDLVPNLCCPLTTDNETYKPELIQTCEALLLHMAEICSAKELLLSLLEQMDCFKDDVKFIVLLRPIQRCLVRLPTKKFLSLSLCFESLYPHLRTIEPPEWSDFEGKERLLVALDERVERSNNVVRALLEFLKPFTEEMSLKKHNEESRKASQKQIGEIVVFLLKILDKPLTYLDLTYELEHEEKPKAKSTSRYLGEKVVEMIHSLEADSLKIITESLEHNRRIEMKRKKIARLAEEEKDVDQLEDYDTEELIPVQGLATFAYLVFGEHLESDIGPAVFTPEYKLQKTCFALQILLPTTLNLVNEKGVRLLAGLVKRIPPLTLPLTYFEEESFKVPFDHLITLICNGQVKVIQRLGVATLDNLYRCFNYEGRHRFFLHIFNKYSHAGLVGKTIYSLKEELHAGIVRGSLDSHFRGALLQKLLRHVFALPSGEKTDLLERNDWIISALSLLRYVVLSDGIDTNATGIWDQMPEIQNAYLETLHKAIQLSKAHYKLSLEQVNAGKGEIPVDLTVTGQGHMGGMTREQQREVLEVSVRTLDMMESVTVRVTELIDAGRKKAAATK